MARLFIRIDFDGATSFGPAKVRLLEMIDKCGSIARAATSLQLSYAHAWKLIEATEHTFGAPLSS
jgi:molybdate transport system regulatory protein